VQVQLKCAAQHVELRSTECKLQLHSNLYCKMKYIIVLKKRKALSYEVINYQTLIHLQILIAPRSNESHTGHYCT
jgi:hypothetical protein